MPTVRHIEKSFLIATATMLAIVVSGCSSNGDDQSSDPDETAGARSAAVDITKITELEKSVPEGGEFHHNQPLTLTQDAIDKLQKGLDSVRVEPPECGKYGSNGGQYPIGTAVDSVLITLPDMAISLSAQELPTPIPPVAVGATDCSRFSFYSDAADGILVPVDAPNIPDTTATASRTTTFAPEGIKSDQYAFNVQLDDLHSVSAIVFPRVESAPGELYVDPELAKQLVATAVSLIRE